MCNGGCCDDVHDLPKLEGHVLCSFSEFRDLSGLDETITSKTRSVPRGTWREERLTRFFSDASRKLPCERRP